MHEFSGTILNFGAGTESEMLRCGESTKHPRLKRIMINDMRILVGAAGDGATEPYGLKSPRTTAQREIGPEP